MKILHVYKDYYPPVVGGIEKHISQVCNHFKHKYEVEALVCNHGIRTQVETIDGVKVTKVGEVGRLQSAPLPPTFPMWLRKAKADILHFHVPNPTCEFSYLLANPPGKVVVTYHSDIIRQEFLLKFYKSFLIKFLERTKLIMPTSPVYVDTSPFLREFRSKCEVVPLGIDTEMFESAGVRLKPEIEKLQDIFGPDFILFVGKLRYYKGAQFLIEAMREVESPLVIVGHGPMENDLKSLAANYRVSDRVHFVGEVTDDDLAVFYHACSMLALPSVYRSEAYGLVQIEAHASGKPVISTRLGTGVEFVNSDGRTGLVVPPADPPALAKAINKLLADPEKRKDMGEFAQKRARSDFDLKTMFERIDAVYQKALEDGT